MEMFALQRLHANRWLHLRDTIVSYLSGELAHSVDCIFGIYDVDGAV
jgi:hypothetical protein